MVVSSMEVDIKSTDGRKQPVPLFVNENCSLDN